MPEREDDGGMKKNGNLEAAECTCVRRYGELRNLRSVRTSPRSTRSDHSAAVWATWGTEINNESVLFLIIYVFIIKIMYFVDNILVFLGGTT